MKTLIAVSVLSILFLFSCEKPSEENMTQLTYPDVKKSDQVYDYFGTKVPDPYSWLENDESEETKAWIKAQNKITFDYLNKIPFREKIKERFKQLFNYEKYEIPFKKNNSVYFFKNDGLQNQSVLYVRSLENEAAEIFLDPNTLSNDGTTALAAHEFSKDGKYFAYATAEGGSDWNTIHVTEVDGKKKLKDQIDWVKFSGIHWFNNGFFYSRFPKPEKELSSKNNNHQIYYHKIGDDQSSDQLIYENTKAGYNWTQTTEDERFQVIYSTPGTSGNEIRVRDLSKGIDSPLLQIVTGFDNDHTVIGNLEGKLLMLTNYKAPKYRLVAVDPNSPASENWTDVIPEKEDVLEKVTIGAGKLFAVYMKNASSRVHAYTAKGDFLHEIELPAIGSAEGFEGSKADKMLFYSFSSFTSPTTIYRYNPENNASEVYAKPEVSFNPEDYEIKQVFYPSKDGTKVSMFIVHKKSIKLDGSNPTYLYAYGGFNISLTPQFSVSRLIILENNGVLAIPNLRGGGEYGEEWHEAGMLLKKQNVFDDFIAAAEYLIDQKYTSSEKLTIAGGSNGGLLVGACMTQRPDLYRVALPAVGVMDMLRYHKFTAGGGWVVEYGSADDSEENFRNLYKYSPLHNIKDGTEYPATLVTTADHDDRVVPAHSFKFISELQAKHKGANPVLIRVETDAGHGAGKPTSKIIDEQADIWSFVFQNLGIEPYKDLP